jgi:hypothetical protein
VSYYPTLAEDVARAKEILARGKPTPSDLAGLDKSILGFAADGGTIYGMDTYAAYKLLESFVEAIEAVGPKLCELALRLEHQRAAEKSR